MFIHLNEFQMLQGLGLLVIALWLGVGLVPGWRRHARLVRMAGIAAYLVGGGALLLWYGLYG